MKNLTEAIQDLNNPKQEKEELNEGAKQDFERIELILDNMKSLTKNIKHMGNDFKKNDSTRILSKIKKDLSKVQDMYYDWEKSLDYYKD